VFSSGVGLEEELADEAKTPGDTAAILAREACPAASMRRATIRWAVASLSPPARTTLPPPLPYTANRPVAGNHLATRCLRGTGDGVSRVQPFFPVDSAAK